MPNKAKHSTDVIIFLREKGSSPRWYQVKKINTRYPIEKAENLTAQRDPKTSKPTLVAYAKANPTKGEVIITTGI